MGRIVRTPASKVDYLDIWLYIAEQSQSADRAHAVAAEFDEALELLSRHPYAGPARDDIRPGLRTYPVGRYLLLYQPMRGGIRLIRVVHGSRNLRRLFRKRGEC